MKHRHPKKPRIIMVPYPAQGHVTPMQKLALAFLKHGFEPVIVLPQYIHRQILIHVDYKDDEIKWVAIADGLEERVSPDFFAIESAMENTMPSELEGLLVHKSAEEGDVVCVVADLLASWAIEVADRCGIPASGFWPAMLATYRLVSAIPDMVRSGLISDTGLPQDESKICFVSDLPIISTEDLPWLIGTVVAKKARFKFWTRTLERSRTLRWLLVNSFPDESNKLELQTQLSTKYGSQGCPRVLPIGPLGNYDQLTKNLSFWEEDSSCLKWLANQRANSVVYISFGSWVSPIGEAKLKSLALALEASGRPFLWVLRSSWREGLPNGFLERVFKQGRVVSWAPQLAVLKHKSVGCYLTHCGWNSTLEALQFKKRLLCYPLAGDQFVNCAYIVQAWRVGVKLSGLGQKDVEEGLVRVMEDKEMDIRLMKLHERIFAGMQQEKQEQDDDPIEARGGTFTLKAFVEDLEKAVSTYHSNN